jgi:hypothetical protein
VSVEVGDDCELPLDGDEGAHLDGRGGGDAQPAGGGGEGRVKDCVRVGGKKEGESVATQGSS